jgi:hypothetical protein
MDPVYGVPISTPGSNNQQTKLMKRATEDRCPQKHERMRYSEGMIALMIAALAFPRELASAALPVLRAVAPVVIWTGELILPYEDVLVSLAVVFTAYIWYFMWAFMVATVFSWKAVRIVLFGVAAYAFPLTGLSELVTGAYAPLRYFFFAVNAICTVLVPIGFSRLVDGAVAQTEAPRAPSADETMVPDGPVTKIEVPMRAEKRKQSKRK